VRPTSIAYENTIHSAIPTVQVAVIAIAVTKLARELSRAGR